MCVIKFEWNAPKKNAYRYATVYRFNLLICLGFITLICLLNLYKSFSVRFSTCNEMQRDFYHRQTHIHTQIRWCRPNVRSFSFSHTHSSLLFPFLICQCGWIVVHILSLTFYTPIYEYFVSEKFNYRHFSLWKFPSASNMCMRLFKSLPLHFMHKYSCTANSQDPIA